MRSPSSPHPRGGDDERLAAGRAGSPPADGGEAFVAHLVDRIATVEQTAQRAVGARQRAEARRELLARTAEFIARSERVTLAALAPLALPLLGEWCVVEEEHDGASTHQVISTPAKPFPAVSVPSDTVELRVPVRLRGATLATFVFGRSPVLGRYDEEETRLAHDFAVLASLAAEREHMAAAAEAATQAKADFLTMMSHELRTPLNAIAGHAQLLEMGFRGPLTDDQRDAVQRIIRGQENLLELVESVLTFGRLTSGRLPLELTELTVEEVLATAGDALADAFREAEVRLTVIPPARLPRVVGDRERVAEILTRLLGNALKFTDAGGEVSLSAEQAGHRIRIAVHDTGRGIPPEHLESIFHPFVQVERGLTRSAEGSGLGLALARELAVRMGGSLNVTSQPGVGSTFSLELAAASPAAGSSAGPVTSRPTD